MRRLLCQACGEAAWSNAVLDALSSSGDDVLAAAQPALDVLRGFGRPCCSDPSCSKVNEYLLNPIAADNNGSAREAKRATRLRTRRLRLLKRVVRDNYRGFTLFMERVHSRNQRRGRFVNSKTRSWKRQASTSVALMARNRFNATSPKHRAHSKMLSTMTWKRFAKVAAPNRPRRLIGGNRVLYTLQRTVRCIQRPAQSRAVLQETEGVELGDERRHPGTPKTFHETT